MTSEEEASGPRPVVGGSEVEASDQSAFAPDGEYVPELRRDLAVAVDHANRRQRRRRVARDQLAVTRYQCEEESCAVGGRQ